MQITIIGGGNMARGIATRAVCGGHTVRIIDREPVLTVRAAAQFADLGKQQEICEAFMDRLLELAGAPWDVRVVQPAGGEPEFRETLFGGHGLLAFRLDKEAELLVVLEIIWAG